MAYSLTSATSLKNLLSAIVTFATAQGWTISYDDSAGSGGNGGQIGLSSGNCYVAIGEQSASDNPTAVTGDGGSFSDGRLYMALGTSLTPTNKKYWGHPGSLVTTAADADRVGVNDIWGSMTEVHFFGDVDYIICCVKSSSERWTTFSFGNLDVLGMAAPACGYCYGCWFPYWDTTDSSQNSHRNTNLVWGGWPIIDSFTTSFSTNPAHIMMPADLLDSTYGFDATSRVVKYNAKATGENIRMWPLCTTYNTQGWIEPSPNYLSNNTAPYDHLLYCRNQAVTGGISLFAMPVILHDDNINFQCFVGNFPDIRICRMIDAAPGEELTYGTDTYKMVPLKRKGTRKNAGFDGGTYDNKANTYDVGYAIKKVT